MAKMRKFTHEGLVRWSETDASGRFHFIAAFVWVEEAEHRLYREIEPEAPLRDLPRRAVKASYQSTFYAGDSYRVRLRVKRVGKSSITYSWTVLNGSLASIEGEHTVVLVGGNGRPAAIPDHFRAGLEAYLET